MTEQTTTQQTTTGPETVAPFSLRIHFEGAFIFEVTTEDSSTSDDANLSSVKVYAPTCEHLHAATINTGSMYMLENYWHCIDLTRDPAAKVVPLQLGALKATLKPCTPMLSNTRPVGSGWTLAVSLPAAPQAWSGQGMVPTTNPETGTPCFSGRSASIIPAQVATKQMLTYTNVKGVEFHGACFDPTWQPVPELDGNYVDLYITSEMPNVIPTVPHQARAIASMASLLGMDLVFRYPLPMGKTATGTFAPHTVHTGGCSMGVVSVPGRTT